MVMSVQSSEAVLFICLGFQSMNLNSTKANVAATNICKIWFVWGNNSKMLQMHYSHHLITRDPHRSVHRLIFSPGWQRKGKGKLTGWFHSASCGSLQVPDLDNRFTNRCYLDKLTTYWESIWLHFRLNNLKQSYGAIYKRCPLACFATLLAPPIPLRRQEGECSFMLL